MMLRAFWTAVLMLFVLAPPLPAQRYPPGYVDPAPLLAAAAAEIGEATSGASPSPAPATAGAVGQTFENAVNIDWPRIDALANYTRTINWEAGTSKETFDRKPGLNPASWKYGLGWQGGTPTQKARASDAHRQRRQRLAHRRRRRAGGRAARTGRALSAGPVAEPARVPQGRAPARRQPDRLLAVGADREGPRRQRRRAREGARRRDHDVREVPRGRHDQLAEPDPAHQDHGERAGARRLQHRARVDQPDDLRQREVADRLAFPPRAGTTTGSSTGRAPGTTATAASSRTCSRTSAAIRCRCPPSVAQATFPTDVT